MHTARKTLAFTGFLCTVAGALMLLAASLPVILEELRAPQTEHASAVYVGAESCFTCHEDLDFIWTQPLSPRTIERSAANRPLVIEDEGYATGVVPVGHAVDSLAQQAQQVELSPLSAYVFLSASGASTNREELPP